MLVVLFVLAAAGQLGAAGRYEPLALTEMQSGNNFHRLELDAQKNGLTLRASSQHYSTEVSIDLNF